MIKNLIEEWPLESPLMEILGTKYDYSITVSLGDIEIDNEDTGYTLEVYIESDSGNLTAYPKKAAHWFDGDGQWQTEWIDSTKVDLRNHLNGCQYEELKGLMKTHMSSEILRRVTCKN